MKEITRGLLAWNSIEKAKVLNNNSINIQERTKKEPRKNQERIKKEQGKNRVKPR
jgi:hypothetical protein